MSPGVVELIGQLAETLAARRAFSGEQPPAAPGVPAAAGEPAVLLQVNHKQISFRGASFAIQPGVAGCHSEQSRP
jgi:hypothetical protein